MEEVRTNATAQANRDYFMALANTRAALSRLPILPLVTAFFLGIQNFALFSPPPGYPNYDVLSALGAINRVLLCVCAVVLVLSLVKTVTFRAQTLFSWIMAGMTAVLAYALCSMFVVAATLPNVRSGLRADPTFFNVLGLCAVLLIIGSTTAHLLLLRRRLRFGHSEKRRIGNFLAVSRSNTARTIWVTVGVVVIVPNVLTRGQYLGTVFGVLGLIVVGCLVTSLPVEFGYLAYLKSKDRAYWEKRPQRNSKRRGR